jgi:hypothetical protein
MEFGQVLTVLFFVLFLAALVKSRRKRRGVGGNTARRRYAPGSGAAGAIHELLIEDKRKAIEIIVEERAEERDPETADGNLPELETPKPR